MPAGLRPTIPKMISKIQPLPASIPFGLTKNVPRSPPSNCPCAPPIPGVAILGFGKPGSSGSLDDLDSSGSSGRVTESNTPISQILPSSTLLDASVSPAAYSIAVNAPPAPGGTIAFISTSLKTTPPPDRSTISRAINFKKPSQPLAPSGSINHASYSCVRSLNKKILKQK